MTQSNLNNFDEGQDQTSKISITNDSIGEYKSIGDVCQINPGSINDKSFDHDHVQYVELSDVQDGYVTNWSGYQTSNLPSRGKRTAFSGCSIISTVRPNKKHYVYVNDLPENLVFSTGFAILYPKNTDQLLPQYLYYTITHPVFIDYLDANATGSAYPAVNLSVLRQGTIPIPEVQSQKEIVERISIFDEKIKSNIDEIEVLKQIRNKHIIEQISPSDMNEDG